MHLLTLAHFFFLDSNNKIQKTVFEMYISFKHLLGAGGKALLLL